MDEPIWVQKARKERHLNTELLIELIQGALEEEGYETKRYSDGTHYATTNYDYIMIKGANEDYWGLDVAELTKYQIPFSDEIYDPAEHFKSVTQ